MASWLDKIRQTIQNVGYLQQQGQTGHKGSWGTREFGISEAHAADKPFQPAPQTKTIWSNQADQDAMRAWEASQNTGGGGGGIKGGNIGENVPRGDEIRQSDIQQQVDAFGQMIDRDYDTAMQGLQSQEQSLQGQAGTAEGKIKAEYAPARTAIGAEQATKEAGLTREGQVAESSAKSAQQQARDMFREIQQQNIATTSGLGISSSSVTEALAERLGVETARRIAGVTGTLNEVRQNIAQESTRIQTYYKQRLADLEQSMAAGVSSIQESLMGGIREINQARNVAATDKANRRQELLSRAQSSMASLKANAQDFAQSLEQWQVQKAASLKSIERDPNFLGNLAQSAATFAQDPRFSQFSFAPEASVDKYGQYTGKISATPKKEDPLGAPEFGQMGSQQPDYNRYPNNGFTF